MLLRKLKEIGPVDAVAGALVLLMVGTLFSLHVVLALSHPYFNQFSNVEDWAYTNIAARNYLHLGFLNTLFLQDYAASMFKADHPFVYNHMPPGPDLTTAAFLALSGGDYHWTRILFGALVLPGLYFYFRFVKLISAPNGMRGAAIALLAAGPYVVMNHLQAEVHSPFLFLCFAPMCWVIESNKTASRAKFAAAVAITFLLSIYIQYILLAAALFAWIFLYVLGIASITRKQVLIIVLTIFAGIGAHLIQNLIYLGPHLFFKELIYTVENRTIGIPTQEQLRQFYMDAGLVHHGAQRAELKVLLPTLVGNLVFRFASLILPALLAWLFLAAGSSRLSTRFHGIGAYACPAAGIDDSSKRGIEFVLRLFLWAIATVVCVILVFPAHTQEVNLSSYGGINLLLFATPSACLIGQGLMLAEPLVGREMFTALPAWVKNNKDVMARVLTLGYIGALLFGMLAVSWLWPLSLDQGITARIFAAGERAVDLVAAHTLRVPARSLAVGASITIAFVLTWLSWIRFRTGRGVSASQRYWTMAGAVTRVFLVFLALVTFFSITVRAMRETKEIIERAAGPNDLAPLADLRDYKGKLFMTNINVPTIGFFTESPGYGVCGRDAIGTHGTIHREDCKVAQMRRQEYWREQRPAYFFYFKEGRVFPGFATCWPKDAYLGILRGGAGCNEELGERLATQYRRAASNSLFDTYDLASPTDAGKPR